MDWTEVGDTSKYPLASKKQIAKEMAEYWGGPPGCTLPKTKATREKMSKAHLGKKHTAEHREANRQARLKESSQPGYKNGFAGKKHTQETKDRIRKTLLDKRK